MNNVTPKRMTSPFVQEHARLEQQLELKKRVIQHFTNISLFQNENGSRYAFINTSPHMQNELVFVDDPAFVVAFLRSFLQNFNINVHCNDKELQALIMHQSEFAYYGEDTAFLSPKVSQTDDRNFSIKLNNQCLILLTPVLRAEAELVVRLYSSPKSHLVRLLSSKQNASIYSDKAEYLNILLNIDDFERRNIDKILQKKEWILSQNSKADSSTASNQALNELIEKYSQDQKAFLNIEDIFLLFNSLNIDRDVQATLLTWMVHTLIPSANQIALQIIGPRNSGKSALQRLLKAILDPDSNNDLAIPKTLKSLHKDAFENHLLSYDDVDEFKDVVEQGIEKLLHGTHIDITHLYKKGRQNKTVKVRRPIIWNSLNNIVKSSKLRESVLTITLPENKPDDHYPSVTAMQITYLQACIIELIRQSLNNFKTTLIHHPNSYLKNFNDFIRIGNAITNSPQNNLKLDVEGEIGMLFIDDARSVLLASVVGDALLTFIESNGKQDCTFKMIEWSEKLESFKADSIKWPSEINKVGAELDRLSHWYKPLGFEIFQSNEKGERLTPGMVRSNYYRTLKFDEDISLDASSTS